MMKNETTLLPCPFCGGEIPAPTRRYMSVLICPTCNAYGPGNSDMTNDELIAAWNTRAELGSGTCEMIPLCSWLFECSKCGERHHKDDLRKYNYCPNCGAKVV